MTFEGSTLLVLYLLKSTQIISQTTFKYVYLFKEIVGIKDIGWWLILICMFSDSCCVLLLVCGDAPVHISFAHVSFLYSYVQNNG